MNKAKHTLNGIILMASLQWCGIVAAEQTTRGDGKALIGIAHRVIEIEQQENENTSTLIPAKGYLVSFVLPNSAAFKGGIKSGDIIMSWDGITLDSQPKEQQNKALRNYLKKEKRVGDLLDLTIRRYQTKVLVNGKKSEEVNTETWSELFKHKKVAEKKIIELNQSVNDISMTIILGKRYDDIELPESQKLYSLKTTETTFIEKIQQKAIKIFDLSEDYQDLLSRYEENQKWQSGYRLNIFQYLHRNPEKLLTVSDIESQTLLDNSNKTMKTQLTKMLSLLETTTNKTQTDIKQKAVELPTSLELQPHWQFIKKILFLSHSAKERAFAEFSKNEREEINQLLPKLMQRFADSYYINLGENDLTIHAENQKVLALMKKLNLTALIESALYLQQLNNTEWLERLSQVAEQNQQNLHKSNGQSWFSSDSTYGRIIIGSKGSNTYSGKAAVIIDLAGDDSYFGDTTQSQTAIKLIIDVAGNDFYSSSVKYSWASAFLGVSLLFDRAGNDQYYGSYFSQATAVGGVSILQDDAGNDRYWGQRYAQGSAFWGIAYLNDKKGHDQYYAWRYAQGTGGVKGIGLLIDNQGNDYYHATGESQSSYRTKGNFQASSQGFGVGFRGYASGGIGILLDGSGQDQYTAGNFSQGVGYFYALGLLRDFGTEDDIYQASRYGLGASAHSAAGAMIEDGGNDFYQGNHIALLGAAWDLSLAGFWDKSGDDFYRNNQQIFDLGIAAHNGYGIFLDSSGTDSYAKSPKRSVSNDYHGGYSFSFFIDLGKEQDNYINDHYINNQFIYQYGHRFSIDGSNVFNNLNEPNQYSQ